MVRILLHQSWCDSRIYFVSSFLFSVGLVVRLLARLGGRVGSVVKALGRRLEAEVKGKVREFKERRDLGVMVYSRVSGIPDPIVRERVEKRLSRVKERVTKAVKRMGGHVGREKVMIHRSGHIYTVTYTAEVVAGKEVSHVELGRIIKAVKRSAKGEWSVDVKAGKKVRLIVRYAFTVHALKKHRKEKP